MADDIVDLVKRLKSATSDNLRVAMPARIESYDFKTQKASVKIDMKELTGEGKEIDYPVVNAVPVMFPSSGGAALTMPVNRGDSCLLIFADRSIESWLAGGSGQKPTTIRSHALSDAIAIIGLNQFTITSKARNNTDVLLTYSDSELILKPNGVVDINSAKQLNVKTENITINCKNSTINIGENAILNSKSLTATITETASITCKTLTAAVGETATITCKNISITSVENISTKGVSFNHEGNMKVTGTLQVTDKVSGADGGTLQVANGLVNNAGTIITSGITIDTHKHPYTKAVDGSSPTVTVPDVTGAMQ
jgi:hypothetical protein